MINRNKDVKVCAQQSMSNHFAVGSGSEFCQNWEIVDQLKYSPNSFSSPRTNSIMSNSSNIRSSLNMASEIISCKV